MEQFLYIKTDTEFKIVQAIPGSLNTDVTSVTIYRLSDGYYWDFTDEEFQTGSHAGTMTFVTGTLWQQAFTPPTDDTYVVTIIDSTVGVTYTQVYKALGDADSFTFRTNSETSICNWALTKIGGQTIISLSDDSETARKCALIYVRVRDDLLRGHPWNFAIKRETLALLSDAPEWGYTYAFALPTDCLRYLNNSEDAEVKIEGGVLYTDETTMEIRYIAKITDPSKYSASFVKAFADYLAYELAFAISGSRTLAEGAKSEAAISLSKAKAEDAQEGTPDEPIANDWTSAR